MLLQISLQLLKLHFEGGLRRERAGGSLQTAAGVKGISGEIKGDRRQGFEPRTPGFGAERMSGSAEHRSQPGTAFTSSECGWELPSGLSQGTMRCFLPALRPAETRRARDPRAYMRSRPRRPKGGGSAPPPPLPLRPGQAARRSDPGNPTVVMRPSLELEQHPPRAGYGKRRSVCAARTPAVLLQQTQLPLLQQARRWEPKLLL